MGKMDDQAVQKTLFLIDDEAAFRAYVAAVAGRMGWNVREFDKAENMVKALSQGPAPSIMFLDLLMPDKDGIEILSDPGLRALAGDVPIYVVTGGLSVNAEAAVLIGKGNGLKMIETIYKPVRMDRIKEILARH